MQLDRIVLNNFRQYHGRQTLRFAHGKEKNVTVIHGINGAGKTSLFLAINWCLYGRAVDNVKVIDNVGELISKEATRRATPGEAVNTAVELTFSHEGERYLVRRSLQGVKQKDGTLRMDVPEEFTMMRTPPDGDAERVKNPVGVMNSIMPANVREYFLFDGEKIDNFARPEAATQVREAVYLVLKLEVLSRARRHLEQAAQEYRKELKQLSSGELRSLLDQDEKARKDRSSAEARKVELENEIRSARSKIAEIENRLRQIQNARALQEQRERIDRDLKQRRTELDQLVGRIRELATSGYVVVAQSAVGRAWRVLDEKRERGEIPSNIRQQFLQDLIDRRQCICGHKITDGSPEHRQLVNLMANSLPGALENDVLDTSAALRAFEERAQRHQEDLTATLRQRVGLLDLIKDLEAELDDVTRQLKGSPLEEISRLEKQRQEFIEDIESRTLQIGELIARIEDLTKTIAELEKAITRAQSEERKQGQLATKLDLAQRAADAIGDVYQRFADEMRDQIQGKTEEIFKRLIWKDSHFQGIELGSDFNLEVIDRYGLPARPELSMGERQVLSLSFITAMSRVGEADAPLVMDTPFGRLSSHHRASITEHLPGLANQLVLFVTDEELRDEAKENLLPRVGAEYRLEFNLDTSCTSIAEVA